MGVYSVAKAGVLMLTRVLAVELAGHNIRVNAISPGLARTEMSDWAWRNPEILKEMVAGRPLGRIAEPADMVGAAIFLASDASSYITGHTILVEGGFSA
jgi:NAD(P)-dependent dehydrogenase (short-subunit alcohol dehydrogenase family)